MPPKPHNNQRASTKSNTTTKEASSLQPKLSSLQPTLDVPVAQPRASITPAPTITANVPPVITAPATAPTTAPTTAPPTTAPNEIVSPSVSVSTTPAAPSKAEALAQAKLKAKLLRMQGKGTAAATPAITTEASTPVQTTTPAIATTTATPVSVQATLVQTAAVTSAKQVNTTTTPAKTATTTAPTISTKDGAKAALTQASNDGTGATVSAQGKGPQNTTATRSSVTTPSKPPQSTVTPATGTKPTQMAPSTTTKALPDSTTPNKPNAPPAAAATNAKVITTKPTTASNTPAKANATTAMTATTATTPTPAKTTTITTNTPAKATTTTITPAKATTTTITPAKATTAANNAHNTKPITTSTATPVSKTINATTKLTTATPVSKAVGPSNTSTSKVSGLSVGNTGVNANAAISTSITTPVAAIKRPLPSPIQDTPYKSNGIVTDEEVFNTAKKQRYGDANQKNINVRLTHPKSSDDVNVQLGVGDDVNVQLGVGGIDGFTGNGDVNDTNLNNSVDKYDYTMLQSNFVMVTPRYETIASNMASNITQIIKIKQKKNEIKEKIQLELDAMSVLFDNFGSKSTFVADTPSGMGKGTGGGSNDINTMGVE